MTNYKALSIFNSLKPFTVGYDDLFSHFDEMTTHLPHLTANNFPPYNIVKHDSNKYDVEMALAGYSKDDVIVEYENNQLTIKSKPYPKDEEKEDTDVIHKGIAKRYFSKVFTIADDVEVKGAELKDGLLKVGLERIVPDHKKAKTFEIK
tara:strand:- start:174 stop:620 length:447 start_codon:yes stop_codon:yes gene_type:complete